MLSKVGGFIQTGDRNDTDRWLIHATRCRISTYVEVKKVHIYMTSTIRSLYLWTSSVDVSTANYPLRVINAFTQIEAAKAYLFATPEFSGVDWGHPDFTRSFWEESMHGI